MADEFTCRSCGPLPRTAFNRAVLSCRKAGDCKACRSAANKRHYAANKWRLRATVAPGVRDAAGLETVAADVIKRHGRRCVITGTVNKPLVVVMLAASGELVPILRRLWTCGVAPGGVLQQKPPYLESPAPPAALDGGAGGDTGTVDAVNSAEPPPSHAPPAVPDAPRPVPTVADGAPPTSADGAPPTSADGAPVRASAPVSGVLAERLKSMKETRRAVAGLMTKGGIILV